METDNGLRSVEEQMAFADTVILTYDNNGNPDKKLDLKEFSAFIKDEVRALGNSATSFINVLRRFKDLIIATKATDKDQEEFNSFAEQPEEQA